MVPADLNDAVAWRNVVALPEHRKALESDNLRRWLHYLARTTLKDGKVEMPAELRAYPIFRKSAKRAEAITGSKAVDYSENEMANLALQSRREGIEEAQAEGKVALEAHRVAAAAVLKEERAALEAALEAALAKQRAEFEPREKPGPGAQ